MKLIHLFSASMAITALDIVFAYTQQDGILAFPLKASVGTPLVKDKAKRQSETGLDPRLTGTLYTIDVTLGTPGQTVSLQFDTGSSETWVNPDCSTSFDPQLCANLGAFTQSDTFENLGIQGGVKYGVGRVDFVLGQDYLQIGDSLIEQQIFGVAHDSVSLLAGILGVGPDVLGWVGQHPFVIDNLATQGFINSRAFSLDLRSIESDGGSVIFGGLDTSKYSGSLEKLPIVPAFDSPDGFTRYWVNVDGLTVTRDDADDILVFEGSQTFFLDSGYTLSGFPAPIFNALLEAFPGAAPAPGSTSYVVDCSLIDVEGTLDFTFGSTVINVPYRDFIWQPPQDGICYLGAFQSNDGPVLGDTFLRAAYVVYDWDNREIHIANNEDCGTNLVAIGSGPDAVPSIEGDCSPNTPTSSAPPTSTTLTSETSESSSTVPSTTTTVDATTSDDLSSTQTDSALPTSYTGTTTSWGNNTATAPPTLTSTVTDTTTYTITSCPHSATDCPAGHVTTETITRLTTYCPESSATDTLTHTYECTEEECLQTQPGTVAPTAPAMTVTTDFPEPSHSEPIVISGHTESATFTSVVVPPEDESSGPGDSETPSPTVIPESGTTFISIPGLLSIGLVVVTAIIL